MPSRRDRLAARALARDVRLAAAATTRVQRTFTAELKAVVAAARAGDDPASGVDAARWHQALGDLWASVGEVVYPQQVERLTGLAPAKQQKQYLSQLVALVQQITGRGAPATQVARFVDDQAQGIITTSRRRIHTILRDTPQPAQVREVVRALGSLYRTEFVADRAARIALDQTLRAAATFEHAAAEQVAGATGREYEKVWVTQGDARVRAAHQAANGQQVALEEDFKVGGYLLRYPRDPAGPAALTVNCRCWVEHVRL